MHTPSPMTYKGGKITMVNYYTQINRKAFADIPEIS